MNESSARLCDALKMSDQEYGQQLTLDEKLLALLHLASQILELAPESLAALHN
jgi:hypothetical protein